MSFKALAFFDQKTCTIGVTAHQILPKFRVSLKVSKLMFLTGQKPKKRLIVMIIFLGFYKVQTLNVKL